MSRTTGTALTQDRAADQALDQALERIAELSRRLRLAQREHRPRRVLGRRLRCGGCGQAYPCGTVRALDPRRVTG